MKKKLTALFIILTLIFALASCSSSYKNGDYAMTETVTKPVAPSMPMEPMPSPAPEPDMSWDAAEDWDMPVDMEKPVAPEGEIVSGDGNIVSGTLTAQTGGNLGDKIIYSGSATVETTDFDGSLQRLQELLKHYGAFLENSSVSGKSYRDEFYGYNPMRFASFAIRVPSTSFSQITGDFSVLGNVLDVYTYSENITARYTDTESHLAACRVEQERLLTMLGKAENVSEMLEIESRLTDVRYKIERLESALRNWQNQVDYSTINLNIQEVEELTRVVEPHRTYWQRMGDGLRDTIEGIGSFFTGAFMDLVVNLPVIIIFIVLAVVVILIIRKLFRSFRAKHPGKLTLPWKKKAKTETIDTPEDALKDGDKHE